MSEDRIEALFLERARLRSLGAPSQMYRATSTGFNPITFEPGPESNPILGGNEIQGFPQPTADDAMQERAPSNEVGGRLSDLATNALQLLGDDFGAAYQQFRIGEVENRIQDGSLQPVDYQMAVIENPTVPLGDYYDAASGTFSGVPSDDYILHQGQLYPRVITDAQTGEEIDLSEDNQLINFGRALMGGMMEPLEGVGVAARATQQLLRGGAPDPTVMNMGMGGATVPVDRAADVSDIGFYSAVNRAVEALPMEKGSASQMRAMIAKGEGVKPEEMAWIGLDDFLRGKKSVTKAEVQEYVNANQVQLEEVTKRGDLPQRTGDEWQELINNAEAQGNWDAADALTQQWEAAEGLGGTAYPDSPKFASYTLPGGENYREVLLTLPVKYEITELPPNYVVEKITEGMGNRPMYGVKEPGSQYIGYKDSREAAVADALRVINEVQNKTRNTDAFRGRHFEEPNVLAHMRLNDRTGPDGERILFIEEIQSDWHQKGRKAGYKSEIEVPKAYAPDDFDISQTDTQWVTTDRNGVARSVGRGTVFDEQDAREYFARWLSNLEEENYMLARVAQDKQVPDAPMKKTWHEMSFRRVARMAAEEGYDAIAWTPGKMQAERYDLSKQIGEMHYSGTNFKAYGMDGEEVISRTGVRPDDLPELIGKEAADRLMSQTANNGLRSLTGEQLEVGGEGMEGFYDKMLKTYAAKWGKKFGAKVGVSSINADGPASVLEVVGVFPNSIRDVHYGDQWHVSDTVETPSSFVVMDRVNGGQVADFETQQAADNFIKNQMADTEVWTLPVTKKMRDSIIQKGVPLFTAGGAVAMSQVEREQNDN